jgi:hypothetical protein
MRSTSSAARRCSIAVSAEVGAPRGEFVMNLHATLAVSLLTLATMVQAAEKPSASGTFDYGDKKYTPAHAVAFHEGRFVKVVLSDKPFDPALGQDGAYSDSDLMAHPSATMTITIDAENRQFFGVRFRDDKGSGADLRCEDPALLRLAKFEPAVVAGSFKCEEHDVTFEAVVLPAAAR